MGVGGRGGRGRGWQWKGGEIIILIGVATINDNSSGGDNGEGKILACCGL